jgi:hypothetical protein
LLLDRKTFERRRPVRHSRAASFFVRKFPGLLGGYLVFDGLPKEFLVSRRLPSNFRCRSEQARNLDFVSQRARRCDSFLVVVAGSRYKQMA